MSASTSALSGNPLSTDPELKGMVEKLEGINNVRSFRRWKASFLKRFEGFLTEKGIPPAETTYGKFGDNMAQFETALQKAQRLLEKGDISQDRTTVKGRNALNEMNKSTVDMTKELEDLIPSTGNDERRKQYNKYHLGAVLVRDGFQQYENMVRCDDIIQGSIGSLEKICDRQQLDAMQEYHEQVKRFVQVMNDLGLYEVMMKCRQFAHGECDEIVLLDPKTGSVIELSREDCIKMGLLTHTPDKERFREEETSSMEKDEMRKTIKATFGL